MSFMLEIKNLSVSIENQKIIKDLSLKVQAGQIHALMGPNGSGKSTLAYTVLGHPKCKVDKGAIYFNDQDITDLAVEKRAKLGIFLAFQYPQEIPGLQIFAFLKEIYTAFTAKKISVQDFKLLLEEYMKLLDIDPSFAYRNLNEGFSGGQKKKLEMLQLILLQPAIAIIDEIDSGLDIDSLKIVANALNICKKSNPKFTVLLVTHYQRILNHIMPDFVHVFSQGSIIKSGNSSLAQKIEEKGYNELHI